LDNGQEINMRTLRRKNTEDFRQQAARPVRPKEIVTQEPGPQEPGTVKSPASTPTAKPALGAVAKSNGHPGMRPELPQRGDLPGTGTESIAVTSDNILVDVNSDEDGMMFRFRWS
jgi:hypothetical protein